MTVGDLGLVNDVKGLEPLDPLSRRLNYDELPEKYDADGARVKIGTGEDGLGRAGPFMLDVGISSTRHIARFWGLAKPATQRAAKAETASPTALEAYRPAEKPRAVHVDPTPHPQPRNASGPAAGITKVIEDALRAAGLMR